MIGHEPIAGGEASRGDAGGAEPPAKAPAEWVEGMVQQMSSAANLADARVRATNELRAFEQAVMQTTNKVNSLFLTLWRVWVPGVGDHQQGEQSFSNALEGLGPWCRCAPSCTRSFIKIKAQIAAWSPPPPQLSCM